MAELQRGVLDALRHTVPQVVKETETTLIRLALESAQKLVADIPISAEMVETVVRSALRQVEDTSEITVQLHPEDLALLRKIDSSLLNEISEASALRLVASSEVSRGGCLVQTRFGTIDARRETKMEALQRALSV
jgi:flagellar assembly protein FliH